jgi:hypothetical protein
MCLFCVYVVLCLGRGLMASWSLVQGVLPSVKWSWNWKIKRPGPKTAIEPVGEKSSLKVAWRHFGEACCLRLQGKRITQARNLILAVWDPRYIASVWTHRKHRFLYCCLLIHCYRAVFTAQLPSNERGADSHRMLLATFLLLRDITACVTLSSAACLRAIT